MQKFINMNELAYPDKERFLVITNAYPHQDQLYRNGFIHRRVLSYMEEGKNIEVFVLHPSFSKAEIYIYQGVTVYRGTEADLKTLLSYKAHIKYLIHFVNPSMIQAIREVNQGIPIIVWIHGFEAEAWHRRWFNFLESPGSLRKILEMSDTYYHEQLSFMNWLYQTAELDITFVHVSKWFKEHIAECDARAISKNAVIIPNVIDDHLFEYEEKPVELRRKILSIRPYASRKYANDLAVRAILALSKKPYFTELEFSFYGDGKWFDETVVPLRSFENVTIHKGFLPQEQIAQLHKEHGVFLCPTRLDSQGVSMCEAMSSGLVPVSTNISAIPEFVEHDVSGLLTRPEDFEDLADALERLYFNPELFARLSKSTAHSIRLKCSKETVIKKELEILTSGKLVTA
ncbi:glycosyltransferase family 4 protein [Bacillus sp. MUM 13]|uniref:glycosyltransferase family 4 protein n=1 Tax=Bacillus sp. MUM 13 TaxID=1678001 RepID=UPI000AA19F78|nr:glycosyltransferase family 4 protein [Bacillus sp. MUM 13]